MVGGGEARQLRLALSMNGGVSMAVWIAGAVAEIDQLRGGTEFWTTLLADAGYTDAAQVDVLVGASAGGLNGVLMAQTIHTGRRFTDTLDLWHHRADLEQLVKGPKHAVTAPSDPREVLDGRYFRGAVADVLRGLRGAAKASAPPNHDLAVFASATLVTPTPVLYRDVPGTPIAEANSEAYFHVAKRGSARLQLDGFAPGAAVADNEEALAAIGRATSSLPGLFAPVEFDHGAFGARLVGAFRRHGGTVEVMDGGVIDNVPIARAIRAIYQSRANRRVRRVLIYLHPDPGVAPTERRDERRSRTAIEVIRAFQGKRGETIRADIELLRQHNASVVRRAMEAEALLGKLADVADTGALGERAAAAGDDRYSEDTSIVLGVDSETFGRPDAGVVSSPLGRAATIALLMRASFDPTTELQWHATDRPRAVPLLDGLSDLDRPAVVHAQFATLVDASPGVLVAERARRVARALAIVVHQAQRLDLGLDWAPTLSALDELLLLCDLCNAVQLGRMLDRLPTTTAAGRLLTSGHGIDALIAAAPNAPAVDRLAAWDVPDVEVPGVGAAGATDALLEQRIAVVVARLPATTGDAAPERVLRQLGDGTLTPEQLAVILLPLLSEPVASDQAIEFVRASGDVVTPAAQSFMGDAEATTKRLGDRIAGRQLHHLGAFFQRAWRENDTRWGQLDAVPALIESILDPEALATLRANGSTLVPAAVLAAGAEATKDHLVRVRQGQLLTVFTPPDAAAVAGDEAAGDQFDRAVAGAAFAEWKQLDRRLSSLLGTRQLTSTAMRAALTTVKVLAHQLGGGGRLALYALRPLLLATGGLLLAGRWATAAITWTLLVLAAPRTDSGVAHWAIISGGMLLALGVGWFVETVVKPIRRAWLLPYALAAAGAAIGLWFAVVDPAADEAVPLLATTWPWSLPMLAAAASGVALLFWMRLAALTVAVVALGGWYGLVAYVAYRYDEARPLFGWDWPWPLRTMWLAWLLALFVLAWALGNLDDRWLRPHPAPPPLPPPAFDDVSTGDDVNTGGDVNTGDGGRTSRTAGTAAGAG